MRVYDPKERTDRTTVLEVGVDVNNTPNDDVNFNARARLTFFDVGGEGSEWRNDLSIGSRTFLGTEFYRPFAGSRFFVAPNAFYEERRVDFFADGDRLAEYSFRTTQAGIDFGYTASRSSELRFGYSIGHQKATRRIGNPQFSDLSGKTSFASLQMEFRHAKQRADSDRWHRIQKLARLLFRRARRKRRLSASRFGNQRV